MNRKLFPCPFVYICLLKGKVLIAINFSLVTIIIKWLINLFLLLVKLSTEIQIKIFGLAAGRFKNDDLINKVKEKKICKTEVEV